MRGVGESFQRSGDGTETFGGKGKGDWKDFPMRISGMEFIGYRTEEVLCKVEVLVTAKVLF